VNHTLELDWSRALTDVLAGTEQPMLVAQPIANLATGTIAGYELLSRFTTTPQAGPDVWFAQADRLGYGPELTARVAGAAVALRHTLPPDTFLTFNVEPHLVSHPMVRDAILGAGRLDRVVVELTEHVQAPDARILMASLAEIREAGGLIAVDDAGTGYAGLGQLLTIRPDIVKLDRDLVAGLDHDPTRRAVVELLGDLTGRMDCWLLAEGIETPGELQTLMSLGVPLGQGWLLGRPAEPWPTLGPGAGELLIGYLHRQDLGDHVAHLVRECPLLDAADAPRAGAGTVLVGADGRPTALVTHGPTGTRYDAPVLAVAPSSAPADVVRRAMSRPEGLRGTPVVCTDVRGRPIGLIDVAELVEAMLASR
jgi:EAL domain-containing protein (putative c-di-GMP-specific phosphodiesterase class I)